jgi:putative aldouronate transport system permease protein
MVSRNTQENKSPNSPVSLAGSTGLNRVVRILVKYRHYYIILVPALVWYLVFHYYPMYGAVIAFKKFRAVDGIFGSPWVGFTNFSRLFSTPMFLTVLRNTVVISALRLLFGFPAPIILSLLFNEVAGKKYLKLVSTLSYLPYFMSWVVLGGIFIQMLSPSTGIVNHIITLFGGTPIYFMTNDKLFVPIVIITGIWQGVGWGTIIYMAVLSGINVEMFEAAEMEGIKRSQKVWYITLPYLKPTIALMLIFACAGILNAGFDQIFNMYNPTVYNVADILDTYIYRIGIQGMDYSLSTAVGLFKNVIGFSMLVLVNVLAKKLLDSDGIW